MKCNVMVLDARKKVIVNEFIEFFTRPNIGEEFYLNEVPYKIVRTLHSSDGLCLIAEKMGVVKG